MKRIIIIIISVVLVHQLMAQRPVPPLWGHRIHDEAHVLSSSLVDELEVELKKYEDSTSNQIAVLVIPSLDGDDLDTYSLKVAENWQLGQKGKDNGVLLLIAINDRKMRIEVGYGLEGVLPDAVASRIIRNEIAPAFRDQNYDDGVRQGIAAIIKAIGGEYKSDDSDSSLNMDWKAQLLIGAFVFGILGIFTFIGIFSSGCASWFLYAFLIPFYAAFPMAIYGMNAGVGILVTYLIGFPLLKLILPRTGWGKRLGKEFKTVKGSGGGWSSGSGWFSGGGGGSSSSGGFSGGGGSFGGGGSSGSW